MLGYGNAGIEFLFGGFVQANIFQVSGNRGVVFAMPVLPDIIFASAPISVLC
ncbi:hypothetical protein [Paraburkholderia dilworthii]|uniref:hypothetical protein n=1 Tax=Paraburkholderia dilworthii TaxID=948106 RepID=UPI000402F83C|nr:hypothetical protein [Paraburkholderia dilworthii]